MIAIRIIRCIEILVRQLDGSLTEAAEAIELASRILERETGAPKG